MMKFYSDDVCKSFMLLIQHNNCPQVYEFNTWAEIYSPPEEAGL